MVDEVLEVQEYLQGKNINPKCLYRICYMLVKWYKQQGLSHLEIREAIFNWGKTNNIYIHCNVNNIIYQAINDKNRLRENVIVRINNNDIQEIIKRFDSRNCKLLALSLLCLAKCSADRDGEFNVSLLALSNWTKIDYSNISKRYLPELIDFGYVSKQENKRVFSWDKNVKSKSVSLKIMLPFSNSGTYILKNNDIHELYDEIFT